MKRALTSIALIASLLAPTFAHANDDMKAKFAGVIVLTQKYAEICPDRVPADKKKLVKIMMQSVDMTDLVAAQDTVNGMVEKAGTSKFCSVAKSTMFSN